MNQLMGIFLSTGHFEFPPYNRDTLRSVYHTRNIDVFKLKQVTDIRWRVCGCTMLATTNFLCSLYE